MAARLDLRDRLWQLALAALERAEAMVNRLGARIAPLATWLGSRLLTFSSHAREAFEDFWAEAQDIRKGKQAPDQAQGEQAGTPPPQS